MGNHYLVKLSTGEIIHIYFVKGNGICMQKLGEHSGTQSLLKDGFYDFDVWCEKDEINIICQNSEGSIEHILYENGKWKRKELLTGKLKLPYPKHFKIKGVGEKILFLYTIRHDGNLLLVSQWLGEEGIPHVVDYISEEHQKFVCMTEEGLPYVFYINQRGQFERKVLEGKNWQRRAVSFQVEGETPLCMEPDGKGNQHFLTYRKEKGKTEFYYRLRQKKIWSEKIKIFDTEETPQDISFFMEENRPTFVFFGGREIRVFSLQNRIWEESPMKERLVQRIKKPVRVMLLSQKRSESVGAFGEGKAELLFQKDFLLKKENMGRPVPQAKSELEEKVLQLEKTVEELKSKIASLKEGEKRYDGTVR